MEGGRCTEGGVQDLKHGERLRPFRGLAHVGVDLAVAGEGEEDEDAEEEDRPQEGAEGVVEGEVLFSEGGRGSGGGWHRGGGGGTSGGWRISCRRIWEGIYLLTVEKVSPLRQCLSGITSARVA